MWNDADEIVCADIGYVEVLATIARRFPRRVVPRSRDRFDALWQGIVTVDVDEGLIRSAARVADGYRLRALDAVHLAAAGAIGRDLVFATWDGELSKAAAAAGFATAP